MNIQIYKYIYKQKNSRQRAYWPVISACLMDLSQRSLRGAQISKFTEKVVDSSNWTLQTDAHDSLS